MQFLRYPFEPRYSAITLSVVLAVIFAALSQRWLAYADVLELLAVVMLGLLALGVYDLLQTRHAILRNYPIVAHMRFILEDIRPELRQYFFEGDKDGAPFPRDKRAIVYQRAKRELDKRPFGTMYDVYQEQYEWLHHSIAPKPAAAIEAMRVDIGIGPRAYSASLLNISAMSYGALSANAIRSLNKGAQAGGFFHDTGEGGVSPYHREFGGDLVWELGSGYFGARNLAGGFDATLFAEAAADPQIKMVELKLSQGAKPGHGGVLPAAKVSAEISKIRGVPMGQDCVSPASHSEFSTPAGLLEFVARMRELSGGKPAGFKLCIGHPWEFMAICKAMLETGITPDFIVIDGKEGGTGAAPLEFMDHVGMPLRDGLSFAHNVLIGVGLRDKIKIGASGKITSAFDMAKVMALGADWCNAARGFMFAVGCIQAQSCHTGLCPTGVTSQDPARQRAIVVPDKAERVANFHRNTLHALAELVAAAGLSHPQDLRPHHFQRRASSDKVISFAEQYEQLKPGQLLADPASSPHFRDAWALSSASSFARVG
ncbi:FMN-binding glutamate synthase family protein [Cypionkella sp.]|uniref:FMN-binding glutamate synthase family protein n=1 Tax=Cypionkella sp. TaxID=2811411 RepID=UPI002725B98E|nr:FMN-binding glutamate synthase family protein [Cypionkella sp.]MDO8985117.1 FMN-binding glutamate synthase family protein [Cypionkella sp.]MDP1577702.1 FMN-binding glutamate synthase family protein [Cypionkella sp.]MDP2047326.1 FMN-binding glutamate synthase family protein [Cypionkella sp.]